MLTNTTYDRASALKTIETLEEAFLDEKAVGAALSVARSEIQRGAIALKQQAAKADARTPDAAVNDHPDGRGFTVTKRDGSQRVFRDGSFTS